MVRRLTILYKIFFIGLLLQFIAFNIVTFRFGITNEYINYIRLWKEAIIGLLIIVVIAQTVLSGNRRQLLRPQYRGIRQWILIVLLGLTATWDLVLHQQSLGMYALAVKYDLLGFIIFFLGVHTGGNLNEQNKQQLFKRYGRVIKRLLGAALLWYLIIVIKPGTLKLFGYDNYMFEGTVGQAAPAAYYTEINQGLTRNQFLFERPVSRGFYLTAFWPIFFLLFLYRQPLSQTRARWGIYGLNVFLTFSRAARGSWFILCFLIGAILFWHNKKKFLYFTILPLLTVTAVFFGLGGANLLTRGFSDTGHVTMMLQGIDMIKQQPLLGYGGASVGPGSHHEGGMAYNPENQFLQIWIEYGMIIFLLWCILYFGLTGRSLFASKIERQMFAIGMLGLAVSGMVLHSFSDRMIVYPFMLLWGIIVAPTTNTGKLEQR